MPEVELGAGTVEYEDTGGDGPVLVLLHGVVMDGSLWHPVVRELQTDHRCVVPTLPLGGHHRPTRPGTDLSMRGLALLIAEFLEKLDLRDVTLVLNDWGGAQAMIVEGVDERIGRLVLTSCEAFDNFPPGLPGKMLGMVAAVPRGVGLILLARVLMHGWGQRQVWGRMVKRPMPPHVPERWARPLLADPGVRRDLLAYCRSVPPKAELLRWPEALRRFDRPALVAWAAEDRVMPPKHGRRLATLLPHAEHVEIPDSYTLIPQDQPAVLAARLRAFVAGQPQPSAVHGG